MNRLIFAGLAYSIAADAIMRAAPTLESHGTSLDERTGRANAPTGRMVIFVHKEGVADTIELSPSGRILTEPHDRPDWVPDGATMAELAERTNFYQTRLGADDAEQVLGTNIIHVDDLAWDCIDPDGDGRTELTVPANVEFRNSMLMKCLHITDEDVTDPVTGKVVDQESRIRGAMIDHYIAQDGKGYTLEELLAQQAAADEMAKTGTNR